MTPSPRIAPGRVIPRLLAVVAACAVFSGCVDDPSRSLGLDPDLDPRGIETVVTAVNVNGVAGRLVQAAPPVAADSGGPTLSSDTAAVVATADGRTKIALDSDADVLRLFVGVVGDALDVRGSYEVELSAVRASARDLEVTLDWSSTIGLVPGPFELLFQAVDSAGRSGPLLRRSLQPVVCGGVGDPCPAICGNGRIEAGEVCDGDAFGGADCESAGFDGGVIRCDTACRLDTGECVACGDGQRNGDEQCDGSDLGGESCSSAGFGDGTLACDSDCRFDATQCESCGNGVVDGAGEACDGDDLRGTTCESQGFDGGTLSCTSGCAFDLDGCFVCGDAERNDGEQCDGVDLGGATCADQGLDGGTLACDAACRFDTGGCTTCGDGVREGDEPCDGSSLGGASCVTRGFDGGTLRCDETCAFDVGECYECGDGERDAGEVCDGTDLGGATCVSEGFDGGTIGCTAGCVLDTAACFGCGDGTRAGDEECDGTDLGGASCATQGFDGGTLACAADCIFDTDGCFGGCGASIVLGNVIGNDLNPAPNQIFVASIDLPVRLATPDAAIVEVEFELTSTQFGVTVQECQAERSGFACEILEPTAGSTALALIRVVSTGSATIGPTADPTVIARPRLRLEFSTGSPTVLVPIGVDAVRVVADTEAECSIDSIEAGSIRVTDRTQ